MLLAGLVDYHVHTKLCGHARGETADYLDETRTAGLLEIGFADHFPLLEHDRTGLTMSLEELPVYYGQRSRLRETDCGVELASRLALECGYTEAVRLANRKVEQSIELCAS
jgi:histidinol-phosphatase (PHP family)